MLHFDLLKKQKMKKKEKNKKIASPTLEKKDKSFLQLRSEESPSIQYVMVFRAIYMH